MTIGRTKDFPYPEKVDSIEGVGKHLVDLYRALTEDQEERITDLENMVIDSLEVSSLTIVTDFKPTVDNAVDIGATTYRFKDLYLSGSLKDDTVTLTVAHAKDAYDKRVDTWGNGLEYSAQTAAVDYNTTNLKITSTELDTIQGISSAASPTFVGLNLTGELDITKASTLLIDLNPGFTGTGTVIDITPSTLISTIDAEWDGININGAALNPSAIGVSIHGIHIDLSGVDLTNDPHIDALYVRSPSCLCGNHAIHSDGEIHVNLDVSASTAGNEYTGIDMVVATNTATAGMIHAIDVAKSGTGTVSAVGLTTHDDVDVIHQHIGTFANADKIWEYDNDAPGWTDVTTGTGAIWDDKDDLLYIGHTSTFSEIRFIFSVVATKDMHFKFYFSAGSSVFTEFNPADDTNGATQNGSVRFTASALSTWATDTVNSTASKYWIKIERTRTSGTAPTKTAIQQLAPTQYSWDKTGAITALSMDLVNTITEFSTDGTMGDNTDSAVPTEAAVVTYVAAQITAEDLDYGGDTGTGAVDLNSQTFTLAGTDPIDTAASAQTLIISHKTTDGYKHIPTTGASTQILQYSAAGTAKWITLSSEATIADNGAITLAGTVGGSGMVLDSDFASNGILKRTSAGVYGIVTDNSTTWDAAQAGHAMLTSLAAMTYASGSFVSITNTNTASIRTYAETLGDIGAEPADATIVKDADFGSAGLCATNGSGTYSIVTDNHATWDALVTESTTVTAPLALSTYDISIPPATTSANGYLTTTDWDTFNGKAGSGANSDITSMSGINTTIATPTGITMSDGGTVGCATNPILTFNDTSNYLNINNSKVFIDGANFSSAYANTKMTTGLTIGQGAADDEILAFKSSDVAHGITTQAETDSYGGFKKASNTGGGLMMRGYSEDVIALYQVGVGTSDNTDKDATALAPYILQASKKTGTTMGAVGEDANLLVIRNHGDTRFWFDEDGDMGYDGAAPANYQDHDDVKLVQELEDICINKIKKDKRKDKEVVLLGIINEAGFVSTKKKNMLLYGTIRQLNEKIVYLEEEIEKLKK